MHFRRTKKMPSNKPAVAVSRGFAGVVTSILLGTPASAEQVLLQPSSYGTSFDGPALRLECVAELKCGGEEALVESFRVMSREGRRHCLDQLLQSLTPEPDFTAEAFRRALKPGADGKIFLDSSRTMTRRLGVNTAVASGMAALAREKLIDDPAVIPPLVECVDHPLMRVAESCHWALRFLTRHRYGGKFFNSSAKTVEGRQRVVDDWRRLSRIVKRPIYDASLAAQGEAAVRAVAAELVRAVPFSPTPAYYLDRLATGEEISLVTWDEQIVRFDVGRDILANWPPWDPVERISLLLFRPGVAGADGDEMPEHLVHGFRRFDFRERFEALDLELRFRVATSDEDLRRRAVAAVREASSQLRAENAEASLERPETMKP